MKQVFLFLLLGVFTLSAGFANYIPGRSFDCTDEITILMGSTENTTSMSDRDKNNLVQKATNALLNYNAGKTTDALSKLYDYKSKLNQLISAAKPKISLEDYNLLLADVNNAIDCILAG